jgi:hypothetical protein
MRPLVRLTLTVLLGSLMIVSTAWSSSVDKYINDLKSSNPDVRANAAYELGCG